MQMKTNIDENLIRRFGKGWYDLLEDILVSDYFKEIGRALISSKKKYYPDKKDIFRAFELCPLEKLKVVCIMDLYTNNFELFSVPLAIGGVY